ncbi:MAG: hypothetical protein ACLQVJ_09025 [Syntrophobacteraceae bacterium]
MSDRWQIAGRWGRASEGPIIKWLYRLQWALKVKALGSGWLAGAGWPIRHSQH